MAAQPHRPYPLTYSPAEAVEDKSINTACGRSESLGRSQADQPTDPGAKNKIRPRRGKRTTPQDSGNNQPFKRAENYDRKVRKQKTDTVIGISPARARKEGKSHENNEKDVGFGGEPGNDTYHGNGHGSDSLRC